MARTTTSQPTNMADCLRVIGMITTVTKTGLNRNEVGSPAYDHVETYLSAVKWDMRDIASDQRLLDCDLRHTSDSRSRAMRDLIHKIASER